MTIKSKYSIKLILSFEIDKVICEFVDKVLLNLDYTCSKVKNRTVARTYLNIIETLEYESSTLN